MKKVSILLTAFFLAVICPLQAQTTKGTVALGLHNFSPIIADAIGLLAPTNALGISFGTYKSEYNGQDNKSSYATIGLSGSAHYFVVDNFSAGLNLNLLHQSIKDKDAGSSGDTYAFTIFMAGPELRYYIPAGAKSKIWLSGNGAFGTSKSGDGNDDNPTKLSRFGGGAGLAIFPTEHFSIDLGLGYSTFIAKSSDQNFNGQIVTAKDANSGLSIDVGFSVYF